VVNRIAGNAGGAGVLCKIPKKAEEFAVAAFDTKSCAALIEALTVIAARAATAIRQSGAASLRHKPDGSPVTAADHAAEAVILQDLERLAREIPIISEERFANAQGRAQALPSGTYFLVDPLDGTREFIAGRDEFTVNIALIDRGAPLLGVIAAPAADLAWRGVVGRGAERMTLSDQTGRIAIRSRGRPPRPVIMISRSHLDPGTKAYLAERVQASAVSCGSSIKFCRIAEGNADLYPRLAPTHDWDVAAGHAIVLAAGGDVRRADGSPLVYGTSGALIPDFIVRGDPSQP
jgi:3'(2'), 5'-bisphosphate nucleotidase